MNLLSTGGNTQGHARICAYLLHLNLQASTASFVMKLSVLTHVQILQLNIV